MAKARQLSFRGLSDSWNKPANAGATRSSAPYRALGSTTGHEGRLDQIRIELLSHLGHRNEAPVDRHRGPHRTPWGHGGQDDEDGRARHQVEDRPARNGDAAGGGRPQVHHRAADREVSIPVGARISDNVDRRGLLPQRGRSQYSQEDERGGERPHGARQMILPASLPSQMRGDPFSLTPRSTRTCSLESRISRLDVPSLETVTRVRGLPFSP